MSFDPILYGPLFVRDAQDVNLVASSADPVDVTVSVGGSSWTVPVTPVLKNGSYVAPLRMREILSSVVDIPGLAASGVREVPLVTLSAGETSMSFRAVYGSAAGHTPTQLAGHWLTWRDQISKTQARGRERLTFLAGLDLLGWSSGTYAVRAKVFFASGDPETVTLASGILQADCRYVTVDASYAAIAAAVQSAGTITAWDVNYSFSGVNSGSSAATVDGYPLRLVLARRDVRVKEFIFCNSFGVEDRVYSSGRSNPKVDGSSVAFLNGGTERELRNDAEEGKEVYSGHISSARDGALWTDFLKARDRHILLSGALEQIVVDSHETDLQDNAIGNVKFTYHLAKLDAGRYFDDAAGLGDYDPGQRYGALFVGDDPAAEDLPSEDLFFLKTRLDEFPAADLTQELLFLIQNPLTRVWGNASLSSIKNWLQAAISVVPTPVWSGPWEDYTAGVAGNALSASLGRDLYDRIANFSGGISSVSLEQGAANGTLRLVVNGQAQTDVTVKGLGSMAYAPTSDYVPVTRKVNNKALSTDITLNLDDIDDGTTRKLFFQKNASLATLIELKFNYNYIGTKKGLVFSTNSAADANADFEKVSVTVNGTTVQALHSRLPIYSDSWISAGGVSGGGSSGGITEDGMWTLLANTDATHKINAAHLKLGSGLSVDSNGNIIATNAGTITSVTKGTAVAGGAVTTNSGAVTIQFPTIPSTLPNPYSLTFGSKTYDGSAAKSITAADLGALTDNQTITLSGDVSGSGATSISVSIGSGKVTNAMLAGSIANNKLANSAITINGLSTSLGGSFSTGSITSGTAGTSSATSGYTLAVPYVSMNQYGIVTGYGTHTHTINNIPNSSLANSRITIGSTQVALGGTVTSLAGLVNVGMSGVLTVQNVTIGSSNEINGVSNGAVWINYSSSGVVGLAYGGGIVGVGRINPATYSDCSLIVGGNIQVDYNETNKDAEVRITRGSVSIALQCGSGGTNRGLWDYTLNSWLVYCDGSSLVTPRNFYSYGAITAGSASDVRLKDNIESMSASEALRIISALRPVTFDWNKVATEHLDTLTGADFGLVAQEVESIIPKAVSPIWTDFKRVDYTKAVTPLIKVAQDHESRIAALERENKELKAEVEQLRLRS